MSEWERLTMIDSWWRIKDVCDCQCSMVGADGAKALLRPAQFKCLYRRVLEFKARSMIELERTELT